MILLSHNYSEFGNVNLTKHLIGLYDLLNLYV
uniref:Uncharacterized protein n=1 Tax=Rhizophora mucronata TaxID=61149 RepID=A0A2P2Q4M1_RHIMU